VVTGRLKLLLSSKTATPCPACSAAAIRLNRRSLDSFISLMLRPSITCLWKECSAFKCLTRKVSPALCLNKEMCPQPVPLGIDCGHGSVVGRERMVLVDEQIQVNRTVSRHPGGHDVDLADVAGDHQLVGRRLSELVHDHVNDLPHSLRFPAGRPATAGDIPAQRIDGQGETCYVERLGVGAPTVVGNRVVGDGRRTAVGRCERSAFALVGRHQRYEDDDHDADHDDGLEQPFREGALLALIGSHVSSPYLSLRLFRVFTTMF